MESFFTTNPLSRMNELPATDIMYVLLAFDVFVNVIYGLAVLTTVLLSISKPLALDVSFAV